jgi:hypothetical protein
MTLLTGGCQRHVFTMTHCWAYAPSLKMRTLFFDDWLKNVPPGMEANQLFPEFLRLVP